MGNQGNEEDLALMADVARGDENAFAKIVEKHQPAVLGTVAKMTNQSPDTEDIAQQVFIRLWKSAERYQPTAKFTTFLFTITRNLVFNATRKKSGKNESSFDALEENWGQSIEDKNSDSRPDKSIEQNELRQEIDRAISSLPEKQRLAVILRRYEKMPYEEIASTLEISVPAVKSQLFRARTALRESLGRYLKE
ncbi:MAG: sigma-70 family RNA polymerase sigma factor [Verrucomicrobiaceae bacterium]|jgi:RNA polymerase sigma-70 factor (ECF subfamily)|nr:sigma-70 family RNA polymerase sigma factor [Akkermansiaceae bacterium]RZN85155.1 MAG: sigma-70 family RNA polymerase sigma factor [Verrucomicrobiaceae bacterium]HAE20422.1 RNA polymerase subunit sigma-24 [Verrucomicrobiales bacterium]HBI32215.1 RNA polymerase subunit sigma-24 [Verrucomicrobiales bacterium]HCN81383.1 RNA polymerase subunit sigma-24 [Verrucomicrobiales bacterium]|tara:strand:- start:3564 stop:4145 length:582 start_codon:yes stop_codon:yes gene_type:complete